MGNSISGSGQLQTEMAPISQPNTGRRTSGERSYAGTGKHVLGCFDLKASRGRDAVPQLPGYRSIWCPVL